MNKNLQSMLAGGILTILSLIYLPIFSIIVKNDSNTVKSKIIGIIILIILVIGAASCFIYGYFKGKKSNTENGDNVKNQNKTSHFLSILIKLGLLIILLIIGLVIFFMLISE